LLARDGVFYYTVGRVARTAGLLTTGLVGPVVDGRRPAGKGQGVGMLPPLKPMYLLSYSVSKTFKSSSYSGAVYATSNAGGVDCCS